MARVTVERRAAKPAAVAALLSAAAMAGCGSSGPRTPDLTALPLTPGAQVVARHRSCDPGASAYCALELVVVDRGYPSSTALLDAVHRRLLDHGWSGANADTGDERAAESPGHRLRVTYATAYGDLKGIDFGWIKRSRPIALALSRAMFARASALSMLLEVGNG
jgi:hypothetical protein